MNSSQLKRTGYTGNSNFLFSVLAILLIPFFANNPSVWCDVRVRDCEAVQSQKQSKRRRQPTPIPTQFACLVRSPQNPLYCRYLSLESCDRQTKKKPSTTTTSTRFDYQTHKRTIMACPRLTRLGTGAVSSSVASAFWFFSKNDFFT